MQSRPERERRGRRLWERKEVFWNGAWVWISHSLKHIPFHKILVGCFFFKVWFIAWCSLSPTAFCVCPPNQVSYFCPSFPSPLPSGCIQSVRKWGEEEEEERLSRQLWVVTPKKWGQGLLATQKKVRGQNLCKQDDELRRRSLTRRAWIARITITYHLISSSQDVGYMHGTIL